MALLRVEEVRRSAERRRFHELGRVLFANEPRWAPPLLSYERWLFSRRHPYRRDADVVRFLARRGGAVVGRCCAHVRTGDDRGWFGAFECADDAAAVAALVEAARDWLAERGCTSVTGPATFTSADEAGVLVAGFEHPGGTGRPWHPPWYAEHLVEAGLESAGDMLRWRLPGEETGVVVAEGGPLPPHAGRFADSRLVLQAEAGAVAAVPDVSAVARTPSLRIRPPTEATIVRCEGDPSVLVPAMVNAAHLAGYRHVWAPWCPDDRVPDAVYRLCRQNWG
ncbi:MAG: hypothetical protein ACRD0G_00710, partial [Acidimicrobiales bacterium]